MHQTKSINKLVSYLLGPKGDIVSDCGSSKLFFELTKEGIYWSVRNIAIFMLSM